MICKYNIMYWFCSISKKLNDGFQLSLGALQSPLFWEISLRDTIQARHCRYIHHFSQIWNTSLHQSKWPLVALELNQHSGRQYPAGCYPNPILAHSCPPDSCQILAHSCPAGCYQNPILAHQIIPSLALSLPQQFGAIDGN